MKTALQDYIEKYITTPDIDIMSDTNREFIYQEGGYSRFFPVLPGGYQPIQAPQGTPPEQGQHALWNSVSQNLQGLGRIGLGNRELKMRESQNKIDNELGFARLELAKQQLSQQDAQFKITTAFEQMRMSNTMIDNFNKLEFPSYRMEAYKDLLKNGGGAAAWDEYNSATTPEEQLKAANKLQGFLGKPELRQWSMEKKRDDETLKDLEILAKADPLSLQYKNISEVASAVVSGQEPPPVDWVGATPEEKALSAQAYDAAKAQERDLSVRTREATILLTEAKIGLMELEGMADKLEYEAVKAAVDAEPDAQKKVDIINGYKQKVANSKAPTIPNNEFSVGYMLGESKEEKLAIMSDLLKKSHTSSMKVFDSKAPVDPYNNPVSNTLSKAIINATGGKLDTWSSISSAEYGELENLIPTSTRFTHPMGPMKGSVSMDKNTDSFNPGHVRVHSSDGSISFKGKFVTKNYKKAKALGYTGKENDDVEYQYIIDNVNVTSPYSQISGEDLRGYAPNSRSLNQSGSTTQQSTTQGQPPYAAGPNQAWEYINGKWILIGPN